MNTPRVNWNPRLTRQLAGRGVFSDKPFCLVDVGASGGIDGYWESFAPSLRAAGFDGLVKEIERLNQEARPNTRYYPYLVGDRTYRRPRGVPNTEPFGRTSAARAAEIAKCNYATTYFDPTGSGAVTKEMIELDQFCLRDHPMDVDFIKTDTDGSDYQALLGARELLSQGQVLGLAVECQFHGFVHDDSSTFRNIDRFLTGLGFSLFDLEVYRYTRAALPKTFVYRIPAQTRAGQVLWCDALYLQDAGFAGYEAAWSRTLPPHKIVKLACVFEIFGLEDCAVELLLKYRGTLAGLVNVDERLDLLTPQENGSAVSYRRHLERFEKDPASFHPAG